jgi:hypothetical protein
VAANSSSSSTKVAANSSSSSTMVAANSQWLVLSICCTCNGNNPTITPFAIHVGQLSSCFFSTGFFNPTYHVYVYITTEVFQNLSF